MKVTGTTPILCHVSCVIYGRHKTAKCVDLDVWKVCWSKFAFHSHISAVCSSCLYHIRDLRRFRYHLDPNGAKLLAKSRVSSHLHCIHFVRYCRHWYKQTSNVFRIDWPVLWQSHHHVLEVFHYCVSFIGYQWNLELISRSLSYMTLQWSNLFIFTPYRITLIPFIEIKQTNHFVGP